MPALAGPPSSSTGPWGRIPATRGRPSACSNPPFAIRCAPVTDEIPVHRLSSFDGTPLAWREVGQGRPLLMLHGLFSHAEMNWLLFGTAQVLADAGFRVILPDFRGHGLSDSPRDAAAWPPDVLACDIEHLAGHLGLEDFDLAGYSLGARTAVRLVVRGLSPRRLVLSGMGLEGIVRSNDRVAFFLRAIETRDSARPGTPEWLAGQFLKSNGVDPDSASLLLRSLVQTQVEDLAALTMRTLVLCGEDDRDNGLGAELAGVLPDARFTAVPGTHMTAPTTREFAEAIRDFLMEQP